jgi:dienelactone hydrolase
VARLVTVSAVALTLAGLALVSACSQAATTSVSPGESPAPASSPAAIPSSPAAAKGAWADQAVTFRAGGMTVYATYRHLAGATSARTGRLIPAVVLIPGNGFTDRNGNTPLFPGSIDEIKAVADWLSADGVASLRFDRLGSGQTGFGPYAASKDTIYGTLPDTPLKPVEQEAAAALKFLARQRGIDPARLGVFGHSEGALYALLLATGADPAGSGQEPLPHVRALGLIEPYHGDWTYNYDPAQMVASLSPGTPVLVTCSNADLRVDCPKVSNLRARLAGAGAVIDFVPLTGVDHVLKQDATGMPANYTKPLPFSPQLRQALRSFVRENL